MKKAVKTFILAVALAGAFAAAVHSQTPAAPSAEARMQASAAEPAPADSTHAEAAAPDSAGVSAEEEEPSIIDSKKLDEENIEGASHMKLGLKNAIAYVNKFVPGFRNLMAAQIFGVYVGLVFGAGAIIFAAWLLQGLLVSLAFRILSSVFNRTKASVMNRLFEKMRRPLKCLVMLAGIHLALLVLLIEDSMVVAAGRICSGLGYLIIFWMLISVTDFLFGLLESRVKTKNASAVNLVQLANRVFRYALFFIALLVVLDICGARIGAVVASLGIGGAALAFASQDTIANFFGSVSIVMDRPFSVGDWIVAGNVEGVVDSIGVRSTRIRTFPKTLVTVPNSLLAKEAIDNWSRMPVRRITATVGLTYSTTADQMEEIVEDIRRILREDPDVDSGSFYVNFTEFNSSSLDIFLYYFTRRVDYGGFLETKQRVNLAIMRAVSARGLSMAFPSRSIYVESMPKLDS